jgi:hypothetical protein
MSLLNHCAHSQVPGYDFEAADNNHLGTLEVSSLIVTREGRAAVRFRREKGPRGSCEAGIAVLMNVYIIIPRIPLIVSLHMPGHFC